MPDFLKVPRINAPKVFDLPQVNEMTLANQLKVYHLADAHMDSVKMEWCFPAGRSAEVKRSAGELCTRMLREGSRMHTSFENADYFDYRGSSLYSFNGLDYAGAGFFSLKKFALQLFERTMSILTHPRFSGSDLRLIKKIKSDQLKVALTDNDIVSFRELTLQIFGKEHSYGYNTTEETIRSVTRHDLIEHYDLNYWTEGSFVILAGNVGPEILEIILKQLEIIPLSSRHTVKITPLPTQEARVIAIPGTNRTQLSVKMGYTTLNKSHSDYPYLYVLNILIGGYFNSRLNKSIREKKGLTYHISSQLDTALLGSLYYITADTSGIHVNEMLSEILKQLNRLLRIPPGKSEFSMIRNYIIGNMHQLYDGVYNTAETLKNCLVEEISYDSGRDLMMAIKTMDQEAFFHKTQQYLNPEKMLTVIAG